MPGYRGRQVQAQCVLYSRMPPSRHYFRARESVVRRVKRRRAKAPVRKRKVLRAGEAVRSPHASAAVADSHVPTTYLPPTLRSFLPEDEAR